jgi:NlpC/P60 family putative phage cell wall peptidase
MNEALARAAIVTEARLWIGTPYRHQASLRGTGCDCLGLVRGVWRAVIGDEPAIVPPYTPDWAEANGKEVLIDAGNQHFIPVPDKLYQPSDVLMFRWKEHLPAKHLAIVASSTTMIHAHDGACVCEVPLARGWIRRVVAVFAFPLLIKDLSSDLSEGRYSAQRRGRPVGLMINSHETKLMAVDIPPAL